MTGRGPADATRRPGSSVWARLGVVLASRALPAGQVRERWRAEFCADLQVLGRRQQAMYTLGVLSRVWALRSALDTGDPNTVATSPARRPPLTCRLNLRHTWRVVSTEDGRPYWTCTSCDKLWTTVRPPGDWSPGF